MIKVKKFLALLITVFLILSNIGFAQYNTPPTPPSVYEGRPIDSSEEGKEYYREGQVVVYPAQTSSENKRMMERFAKGDISEEEMRRIAKSKSGERFDEMEFKKGIMEFQERMERKEAFSYENEGYGQSYYAGPSYQGYSKEQMIFGMAFEHIGDDIDPRDIKQYCSDPNKVADLVITKLKDKVGDLQKLCTQAEEQEAKCAEHSKKACSQIGTAMVRDDATEMEKLQSVAYSCPLNKDAIVEACKKRSLSYMEQRIKNVEETCKQRFDFEGERLTKECERFRENTICDKDKFMDRCMGGIKKEDFGGNRYSGQKTGFMYAKWECYDGAGESHTDSSCKSSEVWNELARKYCEGHCYADKSKCGVNSFSVSGECGTSTQKPMPCPAYPVPQCSPGSNLQTKTDANGCTYYYCETTTTNVCPRDVKQCPDGSYVVRVGPNCEFQTCPTITCPEPIIPRCAAGQTLQKKTDDRGCVYYYCATASCPIIQKPTCNTDETLQAYYDNAGCITSYQCIKRETCPEVSKPSCGEGQSLTTKHDDKGCIVGYECISVTTSATTNAIKITGNAVLNNYDDFVRQCENSWQQQQKICSNTPNVCDKSAFIEKCKEQEKRNYGDFTLRIEKNCELQTQSEIKHIEQRCARIDEERSRCLEQSTKRCEQMKGVAEKCKETLTEENLRKFIVEETKKRCKFTDIIEDEDDVKKSEKAEIVLAVLNTASEDDMQKLELFIDDLKEDLKLQDTTVYKGTIKPNNFGDIKLLPFVVNAKISTFASSERSREVKAKIVAGQKVEEAAGKLASLRDSDVPSEYIYIIEDKASDVLDVSDKLKEIEKKEEQKGLGYKIRLFLGLAKKAEEVEIKQLGESNEKLKNSIETLAKLIDEVPSDVAKAILKEQVESLKKQQEDIEVLIETKAKKAKGLFGIFR